MWTGDTSFPKRQSPRRDRSPERAIVRRRQATATPVAAKSTRRSSTRIKPCGVLAEKELPPRSMLNRGAVRYLSTVLPSSDLALPVTNAGTVTTYHSRLYPGSGSQQATEE